MRRNIRDRLFVGSHAPGSAYWALAVAGVVWAIVAAALGNMRAAAEGLVGGAVMVGLVWVLSRALGWRFWPWR